MFELIGDMDKDQFGDLLKKLDEKEWFTVYDSNYGGDINERAYVTQATKGIFSGIVETKNERAQHSVTTFFEINYRTNSYKLWNGKGKKLESNTTNLNRVFRNKDIINNMGDDNLSYLLELATFYADTPRPHMSYDIEPISKSIVKSLFDGSELLYQFAQDIGYNPKEMSRRNIRGISNTLYAIKREMETINIRLTYKNILKYLGLNKAYMKDSFIKVTRGYLVLLLDNYGKYGRYSDYDGTPVGDMMQEGSVDYSRGSTTSNRGWSHAIRAVYDFIEEVLKSSSVYGYAHSKTDLVGDLSSGTVQNIRSLFITLEENNFVPNLNRLASYLYIDVYKHQGISTFSNAISLYEDYINLIKDYNKVVQYPKYLRVAHDIASKNYNSGAEHNDAVWKITDNFKKIEGVYRIKDIDYPVVLMRTATEINEEATYQSNCLSSYVDNVVTGRSLILSLKSPEKYQNYEVLESWVSFELEVGKENKLNLRQAYQTYNKSVDKSIMDVLKSILDTNKIGVNKDVIGYGEFTDGLDSFEAKKVGKITSHHNPVEQDDAEVSAYLERL